MHRFEISIFVPALFKMRNYVLIVTCCCLLFVFNAVSCKDSFIKINRGDLGINDCIAYAYGDFNADKLIDLFCVSYNGADSVVQIWLAQNAEKDSRFALDKTYEFKSSKVVNLIPGDFNGDSIIDVMVSIENGENIDLKLLKGSKSKANENNLVLSKDFNLTLNDHPFAIDINGDGIIDLFGEDDDGRKYFYFNEQGVYSTVYQTGSKRSLYAGYANSALDANNDYAFDLVLTTMGDDGKAVFEIWLNQNGELVLSGNYSLPPGTVSFGQSVFADFDSDGSFEHLLPVCFDANCEKSYIYVYVQNEWIQLPVDFENNKFTTKSDYWFNKNINIRIADYDLDGYIDLLLIMQDKEPKNIPVLLKNIESSANSFKRSFKIDTNSYDLAPGNNVISASFFDFYEDGTLDVLLTFEEIDGTTNQKHQKLFAFRNEMYEDVYFLKAIVIPGRCDVNSCPGYTLPYGLNYPVSLLKIETMSFEYTKFTHYAIQLSQSSHCPLQLPFTTFGLGASQNFIDKLTISINNNKKTVTKEWAQIIPNSQIVISVNPRDSPYYWKMQLFMTPSKNILLTGISLASTMVCLCVIIIFLQFREKKIDEKERKIESQRFNFDGL